MKCPNCGFEEAFGARECTKCGVIFAKWKAKQEKQSALNAAPAAASPDASSSPGLQGTLIKYAVAAAVAGLLSLGGKAFIGWAGSWMKSAQANAPAARQAAMQSINIPKVDISKIYRPVSLPDSNAMRQAQMQANINASLLNAQRNAAMNAAASAAVRQYQAPVPPGGYRR